MNVRASRNREAKGFQVSSYSIRMLCCHNTIIVEQRANLLVGMHYVNYVYQTSSVQFSKGAISLCSVPLWWKARPLVYHSQK